MKTSCCSVPEIPSGYRGAVGTSEGGNCVWQGRNESRGSRVSHGTRSKPGARAWGRCAMGSPSQVSGAGTPGRIWQWGVPWGLGFTRV